MALSETLRVGAGTVEVDDYGGDFTSAFDMGNTSEEGIKINYTVDVKKVASAQSITIDEVFMIAEELELEFALKAHKMENLAYSFGHPTTDISDQSTTTPYYYELEFGARRVFTPMAIQISTLQPESTTLYDHFVLYRAVFVAAFNQAFTIKNERYIPCKVQALGDSDNSGKLGYFRSEYTT